MEVGKEAELGVEGLLQILTTALGKIPGTMFDSFFRAVEGVVKRVWGMELQRRILVRVPTYHKCTLNMIKWSVRSQISQQPLPQCLKGWLYRALSVMPLQATKLRDAIRGGSSLRTVRMVADTLCAGVQDGTFSATPLCVGREQRAWFFWEPRQVQKTIVHNVPRRLQHSAQWRCRCQHVMQRHPCLCNDVGHLILRSRA